MGTQRTKWPLIGVALGTLLLWGIGFAVLRKEPTPEPTVRVRPDLFQPATGVLKAGNDNLPEVVLTFDDGPHPTATPRILATLREANAPATFFLVGSRIGEQPELTRQIIDQGHEVGNHTMHHRRLTTLSEAEMIREIEGTEDAFRRVTGLDLFLIRPPGMRFNETVLRTLHNREYITVGWTHACKDYETEQTSLDGITKEILQDRLLKNLKNGSILLMHNTHQTADALPGIIAQIRAMGFRIVTVHDLLERLPMPIQIARNARPGIFSASVAQNVR